MKAEFSSTLGGFILHASNTSRANLWSRSIFYLIDVHYSISCIIYFSFWEINPAILLNNLCPNTHTHFSILTRLRQIDASCSFMGFLLFTPSMVHGYIHCFNIIGW